MLDIILLLVLVTVLVGICIGDWRNRVITNTSILITLVLVILAGWESLNPIAALVCLVLGLVAWFLKAVGAGDVKLLSVLMLGVANDYTLAVTMVIAYSGLVLVALMWLSDRLLGSTVLKDGVPYGIPIAVGGFVGVLATVV